MKTLVDFLLLTVFVLVTMAVLAGRLFRGPAGSSPEGINVNAMLDAIAAVESGGWPQKIGQLGERGRCQFMRSTWREYTTASFEGWASMDCPFTRDIERRHLAALTKQLVREGREITPNLLAAAWQHGAGLAWICRNQDAPQRVANLYAEFTAARVIP